MCYDVNPFKTLSAKLVYCSAECICPLRCDRMCSDETAWGGKS